MNSKQRKQHSKFIESEFAAMIAEKTGGDISAEFIAEMKKLTIFQDNIKRLRIKLDDKYGIELEGHWFYIVPADEHAEKAIKEHLNR